MVSWLNLLESADQIVLTEESFADQLMDIAQNKDEFLLNHFATKTCLLIGLSLNDPNLKHLLRRSATANPGQFHYYVCFDEGQLGEDAKTAIRLANFQVYNLITLFMGKAELSSLGTLLTKDDTVFRRGAEEVSVNIKYIYYVTGPMGVGKSTCLSQFYNIATYDEWTQERIQPLAKDRNDLEQSEQREIDVWLQEEFYRKNWTLVEERAGLHLVIGHLLIR